MTNDEVIACLEKIDVQLNWPRMLAEQWPVSIRKVDSWFDLTALQMPWYLDTNQGPTRHDHFQAKAVSVGKAAETIGRWDGMRQMKIAKYVAIFQAMNEPIRAIFPAYHLPEDARLLLDGNHRAVALAIAKRPFELSLLVIDGPQDENALPDLRHYRSDIIPK